MWVQQDLGSARVRDAVGRTPPQRCRTSPQRCAHGRRARRCPHLRPRIATRAQVRENGVPSDFIVYKRRVRSLDGRARAHRPLQGVARVRADARVHGPAHERVEDPSAASWDGSRAFVIAPSTWTCGCRSTKTARRCTTRKRLAPNRTTRASRRRMERQPCLTSVSQRSRVWRAQRSRVWATVRTRDRRRARTRKGARVWKVRFADCARGRSYTGRVVVWHFVCVFSRPGQISRALSVPRAPSLTRL